MTTFQQLYEMKIQYEEKTGQKPYVMLVEPQTYIEIRNELINTSWWKRTNKIKDDPDRINFIFGIPIEKSNYIIQKAIIMNERDYRNYCDYKFMKEYQFKFEEEK